MRWLAPLLLLSATHALAETVTSPGPDAVSVSIYRAPHRGADEAMDLDWLQGFALVTETRRVSIPAGEGAIRFEGVAGGILPESAIVTGLPEGVFEKNQDSNLLSYAALASGTLGRPVTIRRTDRATGKVTVSDAVLRSAGTGGGAIIIQSAAGFEAVSCSGLSEATLFAQVPEGLSAKPTLSVRTRSNRALTATVTLSYLAANFDWQANYVATLGEDGKSLDLFGWVTLASADETTFVNAHAMAIAGRVQRVEEENRPSAADKPYLTCWPNHTTTSGLMPPPPPAPPPPPPAPMMEMAMAAPAVGDDCDSCIVVSANRVRQEDLADLKLYRVPEPVTVAAHSQKQVALLDRKRVPVSIVYRSRVASGDAEQPEILIRARNREADGLGLPLPQGSVAIYDKAAGRDLLLGESSLDDKAIGEDVEIKVGETPNVTAETDTLDSGKDWDRYALTVSNANPWPIRFEAELTGWDGERLSGFSHKVRRKDGKWLWESTIPANGTARLDYRVNEARD
ncbi:DUF4139 domain-containing protein [Sphingomonas cavernae]|uniref:DUF4139 domain-containing protein n=1 Tax=Sphingomonas cavernae TaxID=2320861 RepID=A0A418WS88_9SPHN|nr:hypothetical protein [Sphingomonas cavernae]RJF94132.1 hypothetical protein D3876_07710 [Sphingomonas cavernae]